jgi:hypothetical protein
MSFEISPDNLRYELVYDIAKNELLVANFSKSLVSHQKLIQIALSELEPAFHNAKIDLRIEKISYNSPFTLWAHPVTEKIVLPILTTLVPGLVIAYYSHYLNSSVPRSGDTPVLLQDIRKSIAPVTESKNHSSSLKFSVIDKSTNQIHNHFYGTQPELAQITENVKKAEKTLEIPSVIESKEKALLQIDNLRNKEVKPEQAGQDTGFLRDYPQYGNRKLIFVNPKDKDYIRSVGIMDRVFLVDVTIIDGKPELYKIVKLYPESTN